MTVANDLIESLISYSWDGWQTIRQEVGRVIIVIRGDNVPGAATAALDKSGLLVKLFQRVDLSGLTCSLVANIAGRTTM